MPQLIFQLNRHLVRAVVLVLIPALLVDPALASAVQYDGSAVHRVHLSSRTLRYRRIQQEAMADNPLAWHFHILHYHVPNLWPMVRSFSRDVLRPSFPSLHEASPHSPALFLSRVIRFLARLKEKVPRKIRMGVVTLGAYQWTAGWVKAATFATDAKGHFIMTLDRLEQHDSWWKTFGKIRNAAKAAHAQLPESARTLTTGSFKSAAKRAFRSLPDLAHRRYPSLRAQQQIDLTKFNLPPDVKEALSHPQGIPATPSAPTLSIRTGRPDSSLMNHATPHWSDTITAHPIKYIVATAIALGVAYVIYRYVIVGWLVPRLRRASSPVIEPAIASEPEAHSAPVAGPKRALKIAAVTALILGVGFVARSGIPVIFHAIHVLTLAVQQVSNGVPNFDIRASLVKSAVVFVGLPVLGYFSGLGGRSVLPNVDMEVDPAIPLFVPVPLTRKERAQIRRSRIAHLHRYNRLTPSYFLLAHFLRYLRLSETQLRDKDQDPELRQRQFEAYKAQYTKIIKREGGREEILRTSDPADRLVRQIDDWFRKLQHNIHERPESSSPSTVDHQPTAEEATQKRYQIAMAGPNPSDFALQPNSGLKERNALFEFRHRHKTVLNGLSNGSLPQDLTSAIDEFITMADQAPIDLRTNVNTTDLFSKTEETLQTALQLLRANDPTLADKLQVRLRDSDKPAAKRFAQRPATPLPPQVQTRPTQEDDPLKPFSGAELTHIDWLRLVVQLRRVVRRYPDGTVEDTRRINRWLNRVDALSRVGQEHAVVKATRRQPHDSMRWFTGEDAKIIFGLRDRILKNTENERPLQ